MPMQTEEGAKKKQQRDRSMITEGETTGSPAALNNL